MRRSLLGMLALATAFAPWPTNAAEDPTIRLANTLCNDSPMPKADFFPEIQAGAIEVRRTLCVKGGKRADIIAAYSLLVEQHAGKWFVPYGGFQLDPAEPFLADPLLPIWEMLVAAEPRIPNITIAGLGDDPEATVTGKLDGVPKTWTYRVANIATCDEASGGAGCAAVLEEFANYFNYAQNTFAAEGALAFASAAADLSKDWDIYLNSSRSQTPLELLINSAAFKRNETKQFSPPPEVQWVVLHPSLVVEDVRDAPDGENTKAALMLEIAGANWWSQEKWYLPTGGALVSVYADRPDVDDFRYGVALYFRSVYSIGYTTGGGDDGFLLSFDLLKLIEDKQNVLERFLP